MRSDTLQISDGSPAPRIYRLSPGEPSARSPPRFTLLMFIIVHRTRRSSETPYILTKKSLSGPATISKNSLKKPRICFRQPRVSRRDASVDLNIGKDKTVQRIARVSNALKLNTVFPTHQIVFRVSESLPEHNFCLRLKPAGQRYLDFRHILD